MDDIFKGSNRDPTYKDLMKMEYLKRVLQESLRLYPSVPVISRKSAVDIKLSKIYILDRKLIKKYLSTNSNHF